MLKPEKGSRKLQNARETGLMLLVGMMFCAYMKPDPTLYITFAGALVGGSAFFMHNNSKEHEAGQPK